MAARWVADPPELRLAVTLDTLTAVYHRPSGATHLLASPAPELLDALAEGPADDAELLRRLATRFEVEEGATAVIVARLAELAAVGLVRAV